MVFSRERSEVRRDISVCAIARSLERSWFCLLDDQPMSSGSITRDSLDGTHAPVGFLCELTVDISTLALRARGAVSCVTLAASAKEESTLYDGKSNLDFSFTARIAAWVFSPLSICPFLTLLSLNLMVHLQSGMIPIYRSCMADFMIARQGLLLGRPDDSTIVWLRETWMPVTGSKWMELLILYWT